MSLIDFMTATLARATAPLFLFCMLMMCSFSTASQPVADAQESLSVSTAKLLPAELMLGSNFKLAPTVTVYRGVALYQIDTEFGRSTVVGREGLLQRIDELNAIERLREMRGSEVYKEALKNSASAPVDTVNNLADAPVETIKGIGRGLGGFLADVGYAIVSDDPNQEHVAKTATGFAAAKRSLAFGLGVSPYSSFQPLQDELSEVAWTAVGGGLTVSLGFKAIGGATGTALSATGSAEAMRGLVRDHSPRELQNINYDKLLAMGVKKDLAEAMLDNFNYDPEEETRSIRTRDLSAT